MTKVINKSKSNLEEHLQPFISDWIASGSMPTKAWPGGVSLLIQQLEGFTEDLPILPGLFGEKIVVQLLKGKFLNLSDIKWLPSDEEDKELMYNVKGHYVIAAHILAYQFTQLGEDQVRANFKKDAGKDFEFLK